MACTTNEKQIPNRNLTNKIFQVENKLKFNENTDDLKKIILEEILMDSMALLYTELCEKFGWDKDEDELNRIIVANKLSIEILDHKIVEAGVDDNKVLDAMFAKSRFYSKVGDWYQAVTSYDVILNRSTLSHWQKTDAYTERDCVYSFLNQYKRLKGTPKKAENVCHGSVIKGRERSMSGEGLFSGLRGSCTKRVRVTSDSFSASREIDPEISMNGDAVTVTSQPICDRITHSSKETPYALESKKRIKESEGGQYKYTYGSVPKDKDKNQTCGGCVVQVTKLDKTELFKDKSTGSFFRRKKRT